MSNDTELGYAWTDMGWGPAYGPWRYHVLSEDEISTQLAIYANAEFDVTAKVASVTFQPCLNEDNRSQDRRVIQNWNLPDGTWTFTGVFDGHAGHETADHAVLEIPRRLKADLDTAITQCDGASLSHSPDRVSSILANAVTAYDESLLADFAALLPGGLEGIWTLSEREIEEAINDDDRQGENLVKVLRCMRGSTALIALVDPSRENIWVANLGDCQAVIGTKFPDGKWHGTLLTSNHNGGNEAEVKRVRAEHPGEPECMLRNRVLGAIAVTRALGDHVFKLPPIFANKVFQLAKPGFNFRSSIDDWIGRNLTPPYLSHHPDVHHRRLLTDTRDTNAERDAFLIMCSDGLTDLYRNKKDVIERWVTVVGPVLAAGSGGNAALALLRDALGGDNLAKVAAKMTLENTDEWMDDTTITVQTF